MRTASNIFFFQKLALIWSDFWKNKCSTVNNCFSFTDQLLNFCRKIADLKRRGLALRLWPAQLAVLLPVHGCGLLLRRLQQGDGGSQGHPVLREPGLHAALQREEPRRCPRLLRCADSSEPLCGGHRGWAPSSSWLCRTQPPSQGDC